MTAARSIRRNRFCGADAVNNSPGERPGERDVLIVTDPQRDFCPGGALAVPRGDTIIPVVNRLARRFAHVVITQDWHPADHISFAGAHVGRGPFETIELDYGTQTLWPDALRAGHSGRGVPPRSRHPACRADHPQGVPPDDRLRIRRFARMTGRRRPASPAICASAASSGVTLCGLATDFCVFFSALDAAEAGFAVTVDLEASRAIDLDGSLSRALAAMREAGIDLR